MAEDKDMSFFGHIGELRGHLIRSILAIVIAAVVVGFNINWIMDHIFFGPTRNDFPTFKLVNEFSQWILGEDSITLPDEFPVRVQRLYQQFNVMMAVSIFGGVVAAFPYIVWELWRFISPALHPNERKNSLFIINSVWILFMTGVLCGYFLILPFAVNFGVIFKISDIIIPLYDLSDYTTLFLQVVLGMGVVFLFPVLIYFLTNIGILNPKFMKTYRRHAIVLIMVVAAIITPADVLSMIMAALPLLLLYEFSIVMCGYTYKKVQKRDAALKPGRSRWRAPAGGAARSGQAGQAWRRLRARHAGRRGLCHSGRAGRAHPGLRGRAVEQPCRRAGAAGCAAGRWRRQRDAQAGRSRAARSAAAGQGAGRAGNRVLPELLDRARPGLLHRHRLRDHADRPPADRLDLFGRPL